MTWFIAADLGREDGLLYPVTGVFDSIGGKVLDVYRARTSSWKQVDEDLKALKDANKSDKITYRKVLGDWQDYEYLSSVLKRTKVSGPIEELVAANPWSPAKLEEVTVTDNHGIIGGVEAHWIPIGDSDYPEDNDSDESENIDNSEEDDSFGDTVEPEDGIGTDSDEEKPSEDAKADEESKDPDVHVTVKVVHHEPKHSGSKSETLKRFEELDKELDGRLLKFMKDSNASLLIHKKPEAKDFYRDAVDRLEKLDNELLERISKLSSDQN